MLSVVRESWNAYDVNAILVRMDGRDVRRVPRELAAVLSPRLRNGKIQRMNAVYLGEIIHDGIDVGGGPKLNVMYFLEPRDMQCYRELADVIHGQGRVAGFDMFL